jgi:hypothetical protein
VPAFDVVTPTPILIFGNLTEAAGEVWLSNSSANDIKIDKASLTVSFPTGADTGTIALPPDVAIAKGSTKRLQIRMGLTAFVPPGTYNASVDLTTSAGNQTIPAKMVVAKSTVLEIAVTSIVFTGVVASTTYQGTVVAVNRGNVPITVGPIADEALLEMASTLRVLAVAPGGAVSVAPALGLTPGGTATFTNTKPTIVPGDWAEVQFDLTTPGTVAANRHFRVLPRIATQRFVVDLLT